MRIKHRPSASRVFRACLATLGLALLASCASTPREAAPAAEQAYRPTSLLVFGDHGYELNYLEEKVRNPPRSLEEAIAAERKKWIAEKRPPAEFTPSAMVRLESTGGYVPASGMMPVSRAMKAWCASAPCDAALMLGDNIYPNGPTLGADGVDDAKRFDDILLAPFRDFVELSPGFRIYSTLGNHDWRTSREAALGEVRYLESTAPFYMDGLFYSVKPPAGKGEVEIFVLDTEVLLAGTTVYEDALADDASELPPSKVEVPEPWTQPANERERNMAAWLENALRNSTARWKIVMGHHPLWSSAGSKFEEAKAMRRLILPTLCKYADMYVAGHEHTLEVHADSCEKAVPGGGLPPLPQLVSGAAAKHRPVNSWFKAHQLRKSPELSTPYAKGMIWGYMHLSLEQEQVVVQVITTPNDGSGTNVPEYRQVFARRSAR
jgi:tartrate-resistant acid phosphatase type 5